ncbi:NAD(P)-binding domain-containing protein [Myxococcota bacterium]|nr:NAD(P)-binding domain-containing protein [Myxococcota bacterium]
MARRLVVIGAGPIGLEAALGATARGLDVTVLEKSDLGASLRRWGSTRLFSPFGMNVSARAKALLGAAAPADDAILSGAEHVERVLVPLARSDALAGRIHTGARVVSVGRARMTKGDMPGHPLRHERPFRVLYETARGEEVIEAEHVIDASGVYGQPCFVGAGGVPARGERRVRDHIIQHLGDLEARLDALAGRRVLLLGNGHSAANAILMLQRRAIEAPDTRVTWVVRSPNGRPCIEQADDPLVERRATVARANDLAQRPPSFLAMERRAQIEAIDEDGAAMRVRLTNGRAHVVDAIVAMTGYRPDHSLTSELTLDLSPVTEGVGGIHRALSNVTDCLCVPRLSPADLASGEPGFSLAGSKSYGRATTFLLQTGLGQLETILDAFTGGR